MLNLSPTYANAYSLDIAGASSHFGLARQTLYRWISDGKLIRGKHYLKVGRKPLIIRDQFIAFLEENDGSKIKG